MSVAVRVAEVVVQRLINSVEAGPTVCGPVIQSGGRWKLFLAVDTRATTFSRHRRRQIAHDFPCRMQVARLTLRMAAVETSTGVDYCGAVAEDSSTG